MRQIGVRELKEQASDILRRVREEGEQFEITYHGRTIARLIPVTRTRPDAKSLAEFWARWDRLSEEISAHWPKGVSAVDAIREDRREL